MAGGHKILEGLKEALRFARGEPTTARVRLPDGTVFGEFKPSVIEHPELGMVEYVHEDVAYFARAVPHPEGLSGHYIDAHLAMDDGRLVGLNIWFLPPKPKGK